MTFLFSFICQKERWFGTQYLIEEVDQKWVDRWSDVRKEVNSELHLPQPNMFIPTDFTLVCQEQDDSSPAELLSFPELLVDSPACKMWFKTDYKFKLPKAHVQLHILNTALAATPEYQAYKRLWVSILDYNLSEVMFDANAASYNHSISLSARGGLQLKVRFMLAIENKIITAIQTCSGSGGGRGRLICESF